MSLSPYAEMESTQAFWNANPCGVHDQYELQFRHRYATEPWLPGELRRIASLHASFLEVGCGQGIDSTVLCAALPAGGRYVGIDYSESSVQIAVANAAMLDDKLTVAPTYQIGNAEALDFADGEFEAVMSMGVIHHTFDEVKAISEVRRVLKPGGKAYILLYRKPSLKVGVAKLLRAVQKGIDTLLGTDRCIYRLLIKKSTYSKMFGTMFHECFGVPYMKWYNKREIERLFAEFSSIDLKNYGPNFGRLQRGGHGTSRFGYFWYVDATK